MKKKERVNRRKTHEQFIREIYEKYGQRYTVLSRYVKSNKKVLFRCNECKTEFSTIPSTILRMPVCRTCSSERMRKRQTKTHEQFETEIFELVGDEFSILGEYVNAKTKIKMRHNNSACNYYEFEVIPNDFLGGSRCAKCGGVAKKTHEEFLSEVERIVQDEYMLLERYVSAKTKVKFVHLSEVCNNHEFEMIPNSFLNGSRCPKCALDSKREKKALSNEEFQDRLFDKFNGDIVTKDIYYNSGTKMKFVHVTCGKSFDTTPYSILNGKGCHHCVFESNVRMRTKTHAEFVREVEEAVGKEYKVLGRYINSGEKILIKHSIENCGLAYEVTPDNFFAGHRCPQCSNRSKGEQRIGELLKEFSILHSSQETFRDCKNTSPLPFDFAIYDGKNQIAFLIEYDGEQHFEPVQFGGISLERAEENLKQTQLHDSIKNKYCIDNNIPLLRIPYWDFDNIEAILESELHKHDLLQNNKVLEVV